MTFPRSCLDTGGKTLRATDTVPTLALLTAEIGYCKFHLISIVLEVNKPSREYEHVTYLERLSEQLVGHVDASDLKGSVYKEQDLRHMGACAEG
ncbi:hypothetical protein ACJRO7_028722 [Eucalyptus globulus]|uniref:Uncharacterized protein n=1 Tax=Eucalyptus globulus TaxID=34317 RepID=A0ABD3K0L0_EUCGL